MGETCAYFELSSYPSDPDAWRQWEWPAKIWSMIRKQEFQSVIDAPESLAATAAQAEQLNELHTSGATTEDVVTASGTDVSAVEVIDCATTGSSRFPTSCPREADEGKTICPLHDAPDVGPALSEYIDATSQHNFAGANFSTVDLAGVVSGELAAQLLSLDFCYIESLVLDDGTMNRPLSLCDAHVGTLSMIRGRFSDIVHLDRTRFESALVARDAVFDGQVRANSVSFAHEADAVFERATFRNTVCFNEATFQGELNTWNAVFESDAEFRFIEVDGPVTATWADFHRYADFYSAQFHSDVDLGGAFFHESLGLSESHVAGDLLLCTDYDAFDGYGVTVGAVADLTNLTVDGQLDARKSEFSGQVSLNQATIHSDTKLHDTTFDGDATFHSATFQGDFDARAARFDHDATFSRTVFGGTVSFIRTEFARRVQFDRVSATSPVKLSKSFLYSGLIRQPEDANTYYDLREATLGDVDLQPKNDDLFGHYRICETQFNGFDFPRHVKSLAGKWRIHDYIPDAAAPSTSELVSTYLRAKNGANRVGAKTAASEFFMQEMRHRRCLHRMNLTRTDRLWVERGASLLKWVSNWFFNLTCGYGERPLRTIVTSIFIIIIFAIAYWPLTFPASKTVLGTLSFSTQAFATLIFGQASASAPVLVQFLGAAEGFVGAFLIALFVFTLTRSIHR